MADESFQERTEQATQKRRDDFRRKGQVAQSKEVNTAVLLSVVLLYWFFNASFFWAKLSELLASLWNLSCRFEVTFLSVQLLTRMILEKLAVLMMPFLLLVLITGFFCSFLQVGWLFTTKPLVPDFSKLDPVKGAQRFISKRSLVEAVKSLAKIFLVGVVAFLTIKKEFDGALVLVNMDVSETLRYVGRVAALVLVKCCGLLVVLALLDFLFTRWEMEEKMKMTKQEQKEEMKESEGDPHLKARIRSVQQQMARNRMMAEVPKADVIITNPTHISVALAYRRGEMDAPRIVAKGKDLLALRIRELAKENDVPIVENKPLARALHRVDLGLSVPEELFRAVAEVLAYVYTIKRNRKAAPASAHH
jgi:flagellar biosynthetic protein FlhB